MHFKIDSGYNLHLLTTSFKEKLNELQNSNIPKFPVCTGTVFEVWNKNNPPNSNLKGFQKKPTTIRRFFNEEHVSPLIF